MRSPTTTAPHNPNTANRTISFVVNDGSLNSTASTKTVSVTAVDTPPTVTDTGGTTAWTEASGTGPSTPVVIDSGLTVSDPDNTTLASATMSITGGFQSSQDVLAFSNNELEHDGNIAGSYNCQHRRPQPDLIRGRPRRWRSGRRRWMRSPTTTARSIPIRRTAPSALWSTTAR